MGIDDREYEKIVWCKKFMTDWTGCGAACHNRPQAARAKGPRRRVQKAPRRRVQKAPDGAGKRAGWRVQKGRTARAKGPGRRVQKAPGGAGKRAGWRQHWFFCFPALDRHIICNILARPGEPWRFLALSSIARCASGCVAAKKDLLLAKYAEKMPFHDHSAAAARQQHGSSAGSRAARRAPERGKRANVLASRNTVDGPHANKVGSQHGGRTRGKREQCWRTATKLAVS